MFAFLIAILAGYLAWRVVANGFRRPQSEKLNGFGIFACIWLVLIVLSRLGDLFDFSF